MPSSHTQVVAYALGTYLLLRCVKGKSPSHLAKMVCTVEALTLVLLTMLVAYARIYLGYHTSFQTATGGLLGTIFGVCWAALIVVPIRRDGELILNKFPVLRLLGCTNGYHSTSNSYKSQTK